MIDKSDRSEGQELQGERLVLIVVEGSPGGLGSLFPADMTTRGMWAQLVIPPAESTNARWQRFEMTADKGERDPFWRSIEQAGRQVIFRDFSALSSEDELQSLATRDDYHLLVLRCPWSDRQAIEALVTSLDQQTAVMVIGLPSIDSHVGSFAAWGGCIASSGDVGKLNLEDIPPTIAWLLGATPVVKQGSRVLYYVRRPEMDFTQEEKELLAEHLKGLGYLG